MSERYEHLHYCEYRDTQTGLVASNYVEVMNEQDQKIKELEHRLSNCIEPKFKVGQIVWHCYKNCNAPVKTVIESIDIEYRDGVKKVAYYDIAGFGFRDCDLFATEVEAKSKLRSLEDDSL